MIKTAYFAGGCFWCITPVFKIYGAKNVVSGYSGGDEVNPTYEDVKHQKTGHRETIAVTYDDEKTSYEKLVQIFLANIDPYDGGGQFIDRGHSYTTAIYYNDEKEKEIAEKALEALEKEASEKPEVVIEKFKSFYEAEEYHQDYYLKNPEAFEKELIESGRKK
ncbi:MAG: peptide-methionine (S)-S-oxide reductase MsrA [Lachnospiraceae bacterium]|nr:peptide-methionine (S)-S-oxide reductase MsrA [Lachnospiraceae bacterium]